MATTALEMAKLLKPHGAAKQIVTVIEGIVLLRFAKQPAMLKLWKDRRRVGKRMGRPKQRKSGGPAS